MTAAGESSRGLRGRRPIGVAALMSIALVGGVLTAGCEAHSHRHHHSDATTTTAVASSTGATTTTAVASSTGATTTTAVASATGALTLVTEPTDGMQRIYSLMSGAHRTLDMTMYELADQQATSILESDAARGVVVRVLLDRAYSGAGVNAAAFDELASHGVQVRWAPPGTIFHQKTITVDDRVSAIMTLNLTSEYYSTTRDFAVVTTEPADVAAIEQTFTEDWGGAAVAPGPSGKDLVWSPGAETRLVTLISSARHSLLVENEEMSDAAIIGALESAARRGVDVAVVMTASTDWGVAFGELEAAGVHVRTYASDASLYIHAKAIVADGYEAFVGSQNFSVSSLDYNRELGIVTSNTAVVASLTRTLTSDFDGATPFTAEPPTTSSATGPPTGPSNGAWCTASAAPANDGYSGDYDVTVHSNQPDTKATATDADDTWSHDTDSGGYVVIRLWHTTSGESISVAVGAARCSTAA